MPKLKPSDVMTSPMKLRKRKTPKARCDCKENHNNTDENHVIKNKRIKKNTTVNYKIITKETKKTVIKSEKPLKKTNENKKDTLNYDKTVIMNPKLTNTEKKTKKSKKLVRTESSNSTASTDSLMSFNIKPKTQKNKMNLNTSGSFEKYGVLMPSMKDVLSDQKELEKLKRQVNELKEIEDVSLDLTFSIKDICKENKIETLSCKLLTTDKLTDLFYENKSYLQDILNGKQYSERHERFYNYNPTYDLTTMDLNYNTSMIVFTYDQIELLTDLLTENFDREEKLTSYFFKVLLPEFCIKIFMDVHDMTYEEALMYLETRPIED
ncbi:unnamed protein product [Brassicogethes aeneus]|uniref:Uncharacterized protein n=1 Tax=Brassicogethes aeneus TaxID=1431903 RepID=A0A9P0B1E3_BRAAE|nr:unnamed protein product [Brassicogethes aeneus]